MNVILLSGGSGTRLWPLSNSVRSKQFLKVLRDSEGRPCSMVQRVFRQIERSGLAVDGHLVIATGEAQLSSIRNQLGYSVEVVTEPERRDTMPAIFLACSYLATELNCSRDESVLVMPIDPYVDDSYFERAKLVGSAAESGIFDVSLLGVTPTYPSTKYGYIVPSVSSTGHVLSVAHFVEKPDEMLATELIKKGALWNCGIFGMRLGYVLDHLNGKLGVLDYSEVRARYAELEKISFDYGVVEKAANTGVVAYGGSWKDIGTWNTLCDEMADPISGKAVLGEGCENVHVINELETPIVALGLKDTVVAATRDGILVSDKTASSQCKTYVEQVRASCPMISDRAWGWVEVLDKEPTSFDHYGVRAEIERVHVRAEESIYGETGLARLIIIVVAGDGNVRCGGKSTRLYAGKTLEIPSGVEYQINTFVSMRLLCVKVLHQSSIRDNAQIEAELTRWLERATDSEKHELVALKNIPGAVHDAFWRDLSFGTGGAREIMGPGPNRFNIRTVGKLAQALSEYLLESEEDPAVGIVRDSRKNGVEFVQRISGVFAANGIKTVVFSDPTPTPVLSFAVRNMGLSAGVALTASHNPAEYNGFKVYGKDGCQAIPAIAKEIQWHANAIDPFDGVMAGKAEGVKDDAMVIASDEIMSRYVESVVGESRNVDCSNISVAYSPLAGTGLSLVRRILGHLNISDELGNMFVVENQSLPDGSFLNCPQPNPENADAMEGVMQLAEKRGCDIAIATDPDADRLGVAVRHADGYRMLTGNELGCILLDWICSREAACGKNPSGRVVVTTVVTTPMLSAIANKWNLELRRTLTGFKYCGEQISLLEAEGRPEAFLMGVEESCGLLVGTYVRDKDGLIAALLTCEAAADYKRGGVDLVEALERLERQIGFFRDRQISIRFAGVTGLEEMRGIMQKLRAETPQSVAGISVISTVDYAHGVQTPVMNPSSTFALKLPPSDVYQFDLEDGSRIIVRPSGTEPKLKIYLSVQSDSAVKADDSLDAIERGVRLLLSKQ